MAHGAALFSRIDNLTVPTSSGLVAEATLVGNTNYLVDVKLKSN